MSRVPGIGRRIRVATACVCVLLLAACVSQVRQGPQAPVAGSAEQHQQQRAQQLAGIRDWSLQGRAAISNGRDGGSGRIDWSQQGDSYRVSLSAPVTRQSWTLTGSPDGARLDGIKGGPRDGTDADRLLRDATGWEIPVRALALWLRGLPAPANEAGPATLGYGVDGRLQRIEQGGWTIDYADWAATALGDVSADLPKRLTATRAQSKVRLVVDQWAAGAGTAP